MLLFHGRGRKIKIGATSMEMIMETPLKIKIRTTIGSSSPSPGNMFDGDEITAVPAPPGPPQHDSQYPRHGTT